MVTSPVIHFALLLGIYISGKTAFPEASWEERTPESQGVDSSILKQAIDYLHANSGGVGTASANFSDRLLGNGVRPVVNWPLGEEIKGDHTTHLRRCIGEVGRKR